MPKQPLILITEIVRDALKEAFSQLSIAEIESTLDINQSSQPQFGHYQYNGAMKLAKILRSQPRVIASDIASKIHNDNFQNVEVAGAGFINFTFTSHYLSDELNSRLHDPRLGIPSVESRERVIIDFSSPNTAKEMHVGHLRSTIIGDSLARLFEFLGYDVLRLNHVGDWGTAFGMLIAYIKRSAPDFASGDVEVDLKTLMFWYKAARELFESDSEFKKAAQLEVVALQGGDPYNKRLWESICAISRKAYQQVYDLLDVKIEERGESYYNPMLPEIVAELENKGLIEVSDGAKCIFLGGFKNRDGAPLPLMIQKSDGGYNYDTTDMAALKQRVQVEKGKRIIYITDAGQGTHFEMIFQAGALAGYFNPKEVKLEHIGFGLVLGEDGKKFKTRSGNTEKLVDLLEEAVERASAIVEEKNPEMPREEKALIGRLLGIAAVKYADLSCHRSGNYVFSYERMLRFDGNTAPFLLYAYVRAIAIQRRIGIDVKCLSPGIQLNHPSEIILGLHLLQFQEVLELMAKELIPHKLCDYLYHLAEHFNAFFRDCRVDGSPEQLSRLQLCHSFARTMELGLNILGIQTLERM